MRAMFAKVLKFMPLCSSRTWPRELASSCVQETGLVQDIEKRHINSQPKEVEKTTLRWSFGWIYMDVNIVQPNPEKEEPSAAMAHKMAESANSAFSLH